MDPGNDLDSGQIRCEVATDCLRETEVIMSRRGQRQLSARELAVVRSVGEFRLLDGGQLQRLLFPDGTVIGSRRRTQAVLKRLVDENYLHRLDRRVGGVRAGSTSFCYTLGASGLRLVGSTSRPRRRAEPGLAFVNHHLAVAEVYLRMIEAERAGALEILGYECEPDCWRRLITPFGGSDLLKPDLFVALGVGEFELRWFIEVDLATESLTRVERTCNRYVAYYRSGVEQADHGLFPRVAWLTPTPRRAEAIEGVIARRQPDERDLFAVGLTEASNAKLKGGDHEQQERTA